MRIKFLSIIASFFMVSFLITSCLNDDNDVEYSPDATIHTFELDTAGFGKGVMYKFTIDQINGLIYNQDSLPVHADTIIDRVIMRIETSSGIVTMKSKENKDSLINLSDSIDLTKYMNPSSLDKHLNLTVWAPDMQTKKEYKVGVRVHKHDPDSLTWRYMGDLSLPKKAAQRSVLLDNKIVTYVVENGILHAHTISTASQAKASTTDAVVSDNGVFNNQLPTSIITYDKLLYATSSNKDGKVYQSTDGITWTESALLNGAKVDMLLAPLFNKSNQITKITYITIGDDGKKYFNFTDKLKTRSIQTGLQPVPEDFPTQNLSYTFYSTSTDIPAVMLVGDYDDNKQPTVESDNKTQTTVPWAYMGDIWVSLPPSNVETSLPALKHPTIIYYNNSFYLFGEGFESFYTSIAGIAWKKANKKFYFPYFTNWDKTPAYSPVTTPEFRGRKAYSAVLDPKTAFIWVIFSGETATFKETVEKKEEKVRATEEKDRSYTFNSEIWHGRLNQLWFDIANNKYTY